MSVIQGLQNLIASTRVTGPQQKSIQQAFTGLAPEARVDFLRARTEVIKLFRAIERLAELTNINTRFKLDLPDAVSASAIGLDMTTTSTALNSFEEINASPMSFSPFGPEWDGGVDGPGDHRWRIHRPERHRAARFRGASRGRARCA